MSTLVVAAAQIRSTADAADNLDQSLQAIEAAAAGGARLVVLPEATSTSFAVNPQSGAEPLDGPFATAIRRAAAAAGVVVVVGLFEPAPDGRVYNTLLVTGPGVEASYRKVHLFDAFNTTESATVSPGNEYVVVEAAGVKLGLATCYDVRFAAQFTELGRRGAQVIALPASWAAGPGKDEQWDLLTRARAADAQAFLIAAGQAFQDSPKPLGTGRSAVIDPVGEVLIRADREPALLVQEIELDTVTRVRQQIPILNWEETNVG
ncbi:MAG TPA: nitrilase-related carbon-nitrogen hydrolase [Marmoricola sp.]|nr:nitrilase-related carbon-nitrogen hydrolase [Marmoricola sp.]